MKYSQCLWYALDKWNQEGGYVMLRRSEHWCMPHVLHMSQLGKLTHFVPPAKLYTPAQCAFGFMGNVESVDSVKAKPVSAKCMFFGTVMLFVVGAAWAANHLVRKIRSQTWTGWAH